MRADLEELRVSRRFVIGILEAHRENTPARSAEVISDNNVARDSLGLDIQYSIPRGYV